MSALSFSLPNTVTNGVTVGADNRINVGLTNGSIFTEAELTPARSGYSMEAGVSFPFTVASLAGDTNDGTAVTITNPTTTQMRSYYVTSGGAIDQIVNSNDNAGQVIFTGNDYVSVRSFSGAGNNKDGVCVFSRTRCSSIQGGNQNAIKGIAIDGGKNLWIAESGNSGVLQVPINSPGASGASIYLNSGGGNNVPANEFLHGTNDGGTATSPYGIGIDATGNVWMTNAGCAVNDCAPGSFVLTEIVGGGFPDDCTPVSAQITSGNLVGTEPTH